MLFIFFIIGLFGYCHTNSTIVHLNETIEYHVITMKDNIDLTISSNVSLKNCSYRLLTLKDFISLYSSTSNKNLTILPEKITTVKLIDLCIYIDIKSIQNLLSIRRLIFENCTIQFMASQQREDYDFYPKNLSRWIFDYGQTDTFNQFIIMINHLGPFKFDLQLSNCFKPILSFNHFIPLDTQLIFLNITCPYFQIDEPLNSKTRSALFLTPTLMINTQTSRCPLKTKYQWLNLKRSHTNIYSLRILTCENRLVHLSFDINQTIIVNTTTTINIINQTLFNPTTIINKWTTAILINFSVVFISILMLFIVLTIFLIRFYKK